VGNLSIVLDNEERHCTTDLSSSIANSEKGWKWGIVLKPGRMGGERPRKGSQPESQLFREEKNVAS